MFRTNRVVTVETGKRLSHPYRCGEDSVGETETRDLVRVTRKGTEGEKHETGTEESPSTEVSSSVSNHLPEQQRPRVST